MLGPPNQELPPLTDAFTVWPAIQQPSRAGRWTGGKALTLWLRLDRLGEKSTGDIVNWPDARGRRLLRIFYRWDEGREVLCVALHFEGRSQPLELSVSVAALGAAPSHDFVLRYAGHRLELLADGVLVDEEWPVGSLPAMTGIPQVGPVDRAAIWNRALRDEEVQFLVGGGESVAERESRILGPQRPVGQGWSPRGFNTQVGDCMPFFHAGRFHLFYLFDRRHHGSKWGLGAHQWAHLSTMDLVKWEHHPLAIGLTEESEGSICTGSVLFREDGYHAFYSVRMADGSASPFAEATSRDGIHFTKQPPFARLTSPYQPQSARDPLVFQEPATGIFHLLATSSLATGGGCLAHLVSRDLRHWDQREPFVVPGFAEDPECPDYFEWHGWYYLIFSIKGTARYRMSRSALGSWQTPAVDTFDSPGGMVMKTAAFTGDRRIGAAFVPNVPGEYGGRLLFREIVQHADGTLGTKWPAELPPTNVGSSLAKRQS